MISKIDSCKFIYQLYESIFKNQIAGQIVPFLRKYQWQIGSLGLGIGGVCIGINKICPNFTKRVRTVLNQCLSLAGNFIKKDQLVKATRFIRIFGKIGILGIEGAKIAGLSNGLISNLNKKAPYLTSLLGWITPSFIIGGIYLKACSLLNNECKSQENTQKNFTVTKITAQASEEVIFA